MRDNKQYYAEHKEEYKQYALNWRTNNPEAYRESNRKKTNKWRINHPEYFKTERMQQQNLEKTRRWSSNHPEYAKEFYWKHKEEQSERVARFNWNLKLKALTILGGVCVASNCGIKDIRILQVNHKNGGGQKEGRWGDKMYRGIINGTRKTDDLEVRCANHNLIYEYERGARRTPKGVELECGT